MEVSELEQALGVNPFEKRIDVDRKPEAVQNVETTLDEAVERTIEQYGQIWNQRGRILEYLRKQFFNEVEILLPTQIGLVVQKIIQQPKYLIESTTGVFISSLIEKSYYAGINNFILPTLDARINHLCYTLIGTKENPIYVTVRGNTGLQFGQLSEYCDYSILGSNGSCGENSKNSKYIIKGNTGSDCGYKSENCIYDILGNTSSGCGAYSVNGTYDIKGSTGAHCGFESRNSVYNIMQDAGNKCGKNSDNCVYNIGGNAGNGTGEASKDCTYFIKGDIGIKYEIHSPGNTFKTHNSETYNTMIDCIPLFNIIQLMDQEGNILEELNLHKMINE